MLTELQWGSDCKYPKLGIIRNPLNFVANSKSDTEVCLVAEPAKVLVGELNKWVANPLGPGQTSAQQCLKTGPLYSVF